MKDLTTAKDEVAASRASNISAVERLEVLEKAIRALSAGPQAEPIVTLKEHEMLRQMRATKGKIGAGGVEAYKMEMAGIAEWYGSDQQPQERGRGGSAPSTPEAARAPNTPQPPAAGEGTRTPTPKPAQASSPGQGPPGDQRRLGPAAEVQPAGRKRGPAEEAGAYQRKQEAILSGAAMEEEPFAGAAAVPGAMTQPGEQAPKPMELDGGEGGALSQEEQEQWDRSELARAEELGMELAGKLTAAKEEAAAKAAAQGTGSPGKVRTPKDEKAARRAASRSPYRKKEGEGEEDPTPLATVSEEADHRKVPTDDEAEDEGEPEETELLQPEGSPPRDAD